MGRFVFCLHRIFRGGRAIYRYYEPIVIELLQSHDLIFHCRVITARRSQLIFLEEVNQILANTETERNKEEHSDCKARQL